MMLDEMMHVLRLGRRDPVRFLMLASLLREPFPWLYELGIDAYRSSIDGDTSKASESIRRFTQAVRLLRRGPFLEELGLDKSAYMMIREMEHFLLEEPEPPDDSHTGDDKLASASQSS